MRRVLVFQHVAYEPLGSLDPLLRSRKIRIRYVNFGREPDAMPELDGYDALIVLGGPMNVDDVEKHPHLGTEQTLLRQACAQAMPVLGICLGAQLLAHAHGAQVGRNVQPELGWTPLSLTSAGQLDPVLRPLGSAGRVFQWHGDTFALPDGAELLATGPTCNHQAFRLGTCAYGLQFHLEVDPRLVDRWLRVHAAQLATVLGPDAAAEIAAETRQRAASNHAAAQAVFGAWLDAAGWQPRARALASGHGHA